MRLLLAIAVLVLALALATDAVAQPAVSARAKKCYARKHGKRVRVKCPKKRTTAPPSTPAPATPPAPPPPDPQRTQMANSALAGQMLHHFSTSAGDGGFQGDEILHLCSDGRYKYLASFYLASSGLLGTTTDEAGAWRVTGAEPGPDGTTTTGLLLVPGDGSPPHFEVVSLVPTPDGWAPFIAQARWYLGPSTLCS
jgi:hypothetical protein